MSIGLSFSNFSVTQQQYSAFSSLAQTSSVSTASFSAITDGFSVSGGFSMASMFANLPPAPLPRPPAFSASLKGAAMALSGFMGGIPSFAGSVGGRGYSAFLGLSAMNNVVGSFMSTQNMFGQSSISAMSIRGEITTGPQLKRKLKDEFATGLAAGKQGLSNLSNSPEVTLALNQIMKDNKGKFMKMEEVQKKLESQYGIKSTMTKEKGRKTLKFANGDKIADANGNGGLDMGDYKFGKATESIMKKYGLNKEQMGTFLKTPEGKKALGNMANDNSQMYLPQKHQFGFDMVNVQNNWMGWGNSFLDMNMVNGFFGQAFSLAM